MKQAREVAEAARETEWSRPSFAKELFLGRFRLDLIHPHAQPESEDRERGEAFLATFARFLSSEVDPLEIERANKIPDQVIKGLAEIGAFGMKIPRQYGGLGLSHLYYNRAIMLAESVASSLSVLVSGHQSIGVPQPLLMFGTPEQQQRYLPRVAKGEISAFLLTEPDVGSDPARLATMAVPTPDGTGYVLNGQKLWATNALMRGLFLVMAKVPKAEGKRGGITAFVVEGSSPGVEVLSRNTFMGIRGIENGLIGFNDVLVPAENLVGKEGMGLKIALTTLNTGRLSIPAMCTAVAKWSLKTAREWAGERVQWGLPIGKHDAIAQKLAYMAGMTYGLEAATEMATMMADAGRNDIRIEAAIAKLYTSEQAWQVVDELMQIRGGRGYETAESLRARGERPVAAEAAFRNTRIQKIVEGSSEIQRLLIAREAVDQHLKVAGAIIDPDTALKDRASTALKAGRFYARWFPPLAIGPGSSPVAYAEFGTLATHLRFVERNARKLARTTFYLMARHQGRLERKQALLGRIVDIGAELFVISAAVVKAQLLRTQADPGAQEAAELADLFSRGARRRVDRLFHEIWFNDDTKSYKAAQRVLAGAHAWVEEGVLDLSGVPVPAVAAQSAPVGAEPAAPSRP